MRFTRITTKDGSETLLDARVGESYKSGHAARTETEWVFLKPGLIEHPERRAGEVFRILELGLGLGTNVSTLHDWWRKNENQALEITTVDADLAGLRFLSERGTLSPLLGTLLETGGYREGNFSVTLLETDFLTALRRLPEGELFHTVFFDPFSPKAEPESWKDEIFAAAARALPSSGRLVTYSVSRRAKDGLTSAGFSWQKQPLPEILNKRGALLAVKN